MLVSDETGCRWLLLPGHAQQGRWGKMETDLAMRIFDDFRGEALEGCTIESYHRHGGTSVVLLGADAQQKVAIKIYEKELFEGADSNQAIAELERISRQLAMRQYAHPNLVQTRTAGKCDRTGYRYLVMDYVPDPTLDEALNDLPRDKIRQVIQQVAQVALFLHETVGHVHRDIKPENIAVRVSDHHVTLLDLGLVRPVDGETATDQGAPRFLGTKRYAPPEFLDGSMERTADGWLAVTFYQIGGVLYFLIMQRPLFDGYEGEALRQAVLHEVPQIDASRAPADLVQLTRDCLQKNAALRLSLVSWDRFLAAPDEASDTSLDGLREIVGRLAPRPAAPVAFPKGAQERHARERTIQTLSQSIEYRLRTLFNSDEELFPRPRIDPTPPSDTTFGLRATIEYSSDLAVTVFITCELLDVASQACLCHLTACRGTPETPADDSKRATLYRGSFVEGTFAARLERELPRALVGILSDQGARLNDEVVQ
jgi:serine/threonine protein kinase